MPASLRSFLSTLYVIRREIGTQDVLYALVSMYTSGSLDKLGTATAGTRGRLRANMGAIDLVAVIWLMSSHNT